MAVNKVEINGVVKLDLTHDTVTKDTLLQGVTAHDAAGNLIEGTMSGGGGGAKEPYIEETYDANGRLIDVNLVGYTAIRDNAFYGCQNLALTSLPNEVTRIGTYAFYNCKSLALTSLPSGLTSIGDFAFQSCSKLALTSLPSGLTFVGNYTFYGCQKLSLTSLPSGITGVGGNAFGNCKSLTSITFQGKPNSIASNAFKGCTNLKTINVPWASGAVSGAPWGATNATINYNYTG